MDDLKKMIYGKQDYYLDFLSKLVGFDTSVIRLSLIHIFRGHAHCRKLPDARCYNVVGLLGEGNKKVVLCAHYDTVYNTPGAYDNSSGAAVLLEMCIRDRCMSCPISWVWQPLRTAATRAI